MRALFVIVAALGACNLIGGIDSAEPECRRDGVKNGREIDIDCGGPCGKCEDGRTCAIHEDCANNACDEGFCWPADCFDGRHNGFEADVDCGGIDEDCVRCWGGSMCQFNDDCASLSCQDGRCVSLCCYEDCDGCDASCGMSCGVLGLGEVCPDFDCNAPLNCFDTEVANQYICL